MRVSAPAKVNLHLGVGAARGDGYHGVTTVLHALDFCDEIIVEPADRLELRCDTDLGVAADRNLAFRAAQRLGAALGREPSFLIRLRKAIPHGAGLGGGSSDAAGVLLAMSRHWDVAPDDPRVVSVAAELGADVPFFLAGAPAALMSGRGDVLEKPLNGLPGLPVALVKPPAPVPTAAAYRAFDLAPVPAGSPDAVVAALELGCGEALAAALSNNLEAAACTVVPDVAETLAFVRGASGVRGALLAGSGSACFAICEDEERASELVREAVRRGWWGVVTRLGARGARVS